MPGHTDKPNTAGFMLLFAFFRGYLKDFCG
jgi:hypothetical protein